MHNLRGEDIPPQPAQRKTSTHPTLYLTSQDCLYFGQTWKIAGFSLEKLCSVCGVKGYCPVCTPLNTPTDALPFLCSMHSQGRIQA